MSWGSFAGGLSDGIQNGLVLSDAIKKNRNERDAQQTVEEIEAELQAVQASRPITSPPSAGLSTPQAAVPTGQGDPLSLAIDQAVQKYGIPEEGARWFRAIPHIESSWGKNNVGQPVASHGGDRAMGPWQFMSSTAKGYGLADRMDVNASTDAAARHFMDAYKHQGDWEKAAIGHHAGPAWKSLGPNSLDYQQKLRKYAGQSDGKLPQGDLRGGSSASPGGQRQSAASPNIQKYAQMYERVAFDAAKAGPEQAQRFAPIMEMLKAKAMGEFANSFQGDLTTLEGAMDYHIQAGKVAASMGEKFDLSTVTDLVDKKLRQEMEQQKFGLEERKTNAAVANYGAQTEYNLGQARKQRMAELPARLNTALAYLRVGNTKQFSQEIYDTLGMTISNIDNSQDIDGDGVPDVVFTVAGPDGNTFQTSATEYAYTLGQISESMGEQEPEQGPQPMTGASNIDMQELYTEVSNQASQSIPGWDKMSPEKQQAIIQEEFIRRRAAIEAAERQGVGLGMFGGQRQESDIQALVPALEQYFQRGR